MNMDTRRPGGEFDVTTGVGQLSVAIGEPESYVTLQQRFIGVIRQRPTGGLGMATSVRTTHCLWCCIRPFYVGGNPDSNVELYRGGPPASEQIYLFHSCDEQGYQFVQRIRRYTRGAGATDQQVEWFEE